MANLKNHPDFWMRDDAAAQLDLLEADHGLITVNSAGRTVPEQQELIDRWNRGGKFNRPPYLYEPKQPPRKSTHVANGGIAVDTSSISKMLKYGEAYGFYRPYDWDKPHFEFDPARVKIRPAVPATIGEDEMPITILEIKGDSQAAKSLYDVKTGKAIRVISKDENSSFRAASAGAVVYVSVSKAEYKQRGGK